MSVFKYHAFIFLDRPPPWRTEQDMQHQHGYAANDMALWHWPTVVIQHQHGNAALTGTYSIDMKHAASTWTCSMKKLNVRTKLEIMWNEYLRYIFSCINGQFKCHWSSGQQSFAGHPSKNSPLNYIAASLNSQLHYTAASPNSLLYNIEASQIVPSFIIAGRRTLQSVS